MGAAEVIVHVDKVRKNNYTLSNECNYVEFMRLPVPILMLRENRVMTVILLRRNYIALNSSSLTKQNIQADFVAALALVEADSIAGDFIGITKP